MTIIMSDAEYTIDQGAVPLVQYCKYIAYPECAFFGITNEADGNVHVWTKQERDILLNALLEAEQIIVQTLGYPLRKTWFVNERHTVAPRFFTKWSRVIALGTKEETLLETVALDLTGDPAQLTLTVDYSDDVHFFQHDTSVEIFPSKVEDGVAYFPFARILKASLQEAGGNYEDDIYCESVDVIEITTDETKAGVFVEDDPPEDLTGYVYFSNLGVVSFTKDITTLYEYVDINYCAGEAVSGMVDAIISLAHARLPIAPGNGAGRTRVLWEQARRVPDWLPKARLNLSMGTQDGAWKAYSFASQNKRLRSSLL